MMSSKLAAEIAMIVVALSHESLRSGGGAGWSCAPHVDEKPTTHNALAAATSAAAPAERPKRRDRFSSTAGTLASSPPKSQLAWRGRRQTAGVALGPVR